MASCPSQAFPSRGPGSFKLAFGILVNLYLVSFCLPGLICSAIRADSTRSLLARIKVKEPEAEGVCSQASHRHKGREAKKKCGAGGGVCFYTKTLFCLGLFVSKNLKKVFVFNSREDCCLTLGSFFQVNFSEVILVPPKPDLGTAGLGRGDMAKSTVSENACL